MIYFDDEDYHSRPSQEKESCGRKEWVLLSINVDNGGSPDPVFRSFFVILNIINAYCREDMENAV